MLPSACKWPLSYKLFYDFQPISKFLALGLSVSVSLSSLFLPASRSFLPFLPPSLPLRPFSRSFLLDPLPSSAFDISLAIRPFMLRYKFALKARRLSPSKTPSLGHVRSLQHLPPPNPSPRPHHLQFIFPPSGYPVLISLVVLIFFRFVFRFFR